MCTQKFLDDGILLPFASPRTCFNIPNPTLFESADKWLMDNFDDPMAGWPLSEVFAIRAFPRNDVNAKLFYYIMGQLISFQQRLRSIRIDFRLYKGDMRDIHAVFRGEKYDRIEVLHLFRT